MIETIKCWDGFETIALGDLFQNAAYLPKTNHAEPGALGLESASQFRWFRSIEEISVVAGGPLSGVLLLDPHSVYHRGLVRLQAGDVVIRSMTGENHARLKLHYIRAVDDRPLYSSDSNVVLRLKENAPMEADTAAYIINSKSARPVRQSLLSGINHIMASALWRELRKMKIPVITGKLADNLRGLIRANEELRINKLKQVELIGELCEAVLNQLITTGSAKNQDAQEAYAAMGNGSRAFLAACDANEAAKAAPRKKKAWSVIGYYPDNDQAYNGEHHAYTARLAAIDAMELAQDSGTQLYVVDVLEGSQQAHGIGDKVITDVDDLQMFTIRYSHTACSATWEDTYECACNGECPVCGTKDIEPVMWKDVDDEWSEIQEDQWNTILEVIRVAAAARQAPGQAT